jgi:kynurenine formamidase
MIELPGYDDLPLAADGTRCGWGVFGEHDSAGLINLLTPERVRAGLAAARTGHVFSLNAPLDFFDPPLFRRAAVRQDVRQVRGGLILDETWHDLNPQSSSQWDSLGHVAARPGHFYNGATLNEVLHAGRDTVDNWARRGIVGRGVRADLERTAAAAGRPYSPGTNHAFSVPDLAAAIEAARTPVGTGDILVVRTGFLAWYAGLTRAGREEVQDNAALRACGLEHTEAMARFLWDLHVSAVVTDCPALEVWPMDYERPFGCLHTVLIGQLGLAIGELWALDELAADCATDGVCEFLVTSAPVNMPGGIGSTANALAIK